VRLARIAHRGNEVASVWQPDIVIRMVALSAVVVQLSDVHIGSRLQGGGVVPRAQGHDERALKALPHALQSIVRSELGEKGLVITGDASATGDNSELAMYRTIVDLGFIVDAHLSLRALRDGFDFFLDIPGNHDYWRGIVLLNPVVTAGPRQQFFAPEPWTFNLRLGRTLVAIHGLCSTSGCGATQQLLAVGACRPQDAANIDEHVKNANELAKMNGLSVHHILATHQVVGTGTLDVAQQWGASRQRASASPRTYLGKCSLRDQDDLHVWRRTRLADAPGHRRGHAGDRPLCLGCCS
jgi:hypothetical protein